ncbi:MAG: UDP-N-acetylglucosamine 2-epimerase (non-hydrolyzing) [Actinomycetota bacterium]|nr:UDP-N-acetylglucosamine 2-epimerase (non-hydrolyzing) [Actinomycetota bacterium]MDI6821545.1 UDP-N-acetylglucosamine 2-epimerase (non-hydrolyzing) [Actinomycetota bacterium]
MKKIAVILGTRPEIIKMAPVIRALEGRNMCYFLLHTGQHYSYTMDEIFFRNLELPQPKYNLGIGSGSHGVQTGKMLVEIERVLREENPDIALAEGDTNTVVASALVSSKLPVKFGHVEAGLRSDDRAMPEEINRIIADHISDYLFAPTETAKDNLLKEGIPEDKIFVTGNTIVDAVYQNLEIARRRGSSQWQAGEEYFLVTLHRAENTDDAERLERILRGLNKIQEKYKVSIVYPIHPRTLKMIKEYNLENLVESIEVIEPLGYLDFLLLESEAKLILTDSGGVQEESCVLGVPCVTLRDNTERPETLEVGSNILAGTEPARMLESVDEMLKARRDWEIPFGDGKSGERIVRLIKALLEARSEDLACE